MTKTQFDRAAILFDNPVPGGSLPSRGLLVGPSQDSGFESCDGLDEDIRWIRQWYPKARMDYHYWVEGDETAPLSIWESEDSNVDSLFQCVWVDAETL